MMPLPEAGGCACATRSGSKWFTYIGKCNEIDIEAVHTLARLYKVL